MRKRGEGKSIRTGEIPDQPNGPYAEIGFSTTE